MLVEEKIIDFKTSKLAFEKGFDCYGWSAFMYESKFIENGCYYINELKGYINSKGISKAEDIKTTPSFITYKIKAGDSWWKIAQEQMGNGARCEELAKYNGMTTKTVIQPNRHYAAHDRLVKKNDKTPEEQARQRELFYTLKESEQINGTWVGVEGSRTLPFAELVVLSKSLYCCM